MPLEYSHQKLLRWYDKHRRKLPWRERPSPYRTWISEIMLQQTQVATVLPYYERFLKRFPDIFSLARTKESEVLRFWAGLGYYSRARNLHRAAKLIVERHGGKFPETPDEVMDLPGIGRYTAGAILSIALDKRLPVVDGNVARVLSRLFGIHGNIKSGNIQKRLWKLASELVHPNRPGDWNQALMELGALVCLPEFPRCGVCPLTTYCLAFKKGLQDQLPVVQPGKKPIRLRWICLWIAQDGKVLLHRRPDSEKFLPGHWGLPEARHIPSAKPGRVLSRIHHTITHHHITMDLREARFPPEHLPPEARWLLKRQIHRHLVSSVWTKALANVL